MGDKNSPNNKEYIPMSITMMKPRNFVTTNSLFDNLFDPFFESVLATPTRMKTSHVDAKVFSEKDKYIISIAAPGLDKEDFNISITDGRISVKCDKKETEFGSRSFAKSWVLPEGTTPENISAEYKQGILKVNVEKSQPQEPETFTIEVK